MISTPVRTSAPARTIRVMIVDDHPLVRDGIRLRIQSEPDMTVCSEAEDVSDALHLLSEKCPDVAIVDLSLKTGNGLDLVERMRARVPELCIIVSSMHDERLYAERALRAGAQGYVHKQNSSLALIDAIRQVLNGRLYASEEVVQRMLNCKIARKSAGNGSPISDLTTRELEVFERLGQGATVNQIAEAVKLSPKTIETHRDRIRQKLGIDSSHELMHYAFSWVRDHNC